jgi:2-polyprenyl-3-methyl-5-hydroxy-6-metoxy-1,4-benzoquinol methylase
MNKTGRWQVAQFFEIRWWKNYLKGKDVESYLKWKKSYWKDFLSKINQSVKIEESSKILDAGCGPAGIFMELQDYDVTAIDPLLDQYNDNLAHFKKKKYPNTKFETVPLERYENSNTFDIIFCINAINHVSDLSKAFEQLCKSAKAGGTIVVSIDAHNYSFLKHIFRLQPADILHPHQFDLKEYQEMLTSLNCAILQTVVIKKEFLFNHYVLVARKN